MRLHYVQENVKHCIFEINKKVINFNDHLTSSQFKEARKIIRFQTSQCNIGFFCRIDVLTELCQFKHFNIPIKRALQVNNLG